MRTNGGFTLAETLMVIAITIMVSTLTLFSLSKYGSTEAISKDQARVVSVLEKARALTLDSYNATQYGVHFGTSSVVLFTGASYSGSSPSNVVTNLNSRVQIYSTALSGGGSDVVFNRLSGETNQPGTTTLALKTATSTTKTITIYGSGLIQPN